MAELAGKVAIVLGAGGMGPVIARRFVKEGATVMLSGRNAESLSAKAEKLGVAWEPCDISRQADIENLVAATKKRFGRVDIGLNATGWGLLKPFLENTREDLERMTAVQFVGPFQFYQELIKAMPQGGAIIQISSATATIMVENHAAYMGTKAGTDHVIRCVANEFGKQGIRANSISPGLTDTSMGAVAFKNPAIVERFRKEYPLGRLGTSEDIAAAAVWLASDDCFMTGQNLQVNGGLTLRRNPTWAEMAALMGA